MSDYINTSLQPASGARMSWDAMDDPAESSFAATAGSVARPTPEECAEASLQTAINALRAGRFVDSYIECAAAMAAIVKAKELRSPKPPNAPGELRPPGQKP